MTKKYHLTFNERERLVILFTQGYSIRQARECIGRDHSCIVRELKKTKRNRLTYSVVDAEMYTRKQRRKSKKEKKIEKNPQLKRYIHEKLKIRWSPEQTANTLKNVYAQDTTMHISHESIYIHIHIYVLPRGDLRKEFVKVVKRLPKEMCKSLTHDRGSEMSQHELFTKETKVQVYFADPHSLWQRGTNENTNGLIRQFFPKGTDFNTVSKKELKYVQNLLNERPRKTLNWKTPKESFKELLVNGAVVV